ncbi:MAG: tetratricopeptide repeat protein, partial [Ignavibacteriales bacterium]
MYGKRRKAAAFLALVIFLFNLTGCSPFGNQRSATAGAEKKLELAAKYLTENKFKEAVLAYQEVVKIDNKNVTAYKGLVLAYFLQDKSNKAEKTLKDGLKALPGNEQLQLAMAGLLLEEGKNDQAEAIYRQLLGEKDSSELVYMAYCNYLNHKGEMSAAIAILEKAAAKDKGQYQLDNMLAELYMKSGEKEKALAALNRSVNLEPDQSSAYKILTELYKDSWSELTALGDQYIREKQTRSGVLFKLEALYGMKQFEELITEYKKLSAELKTTPRLKLLAAEASVKLGKSAEADEYFGSIKVSSIKDAGMLAELANYCLESGDPEQARQIAMLGIEADGSVMDNYLVMYTANGGASRSDAAIWLVKYMINSTTGLSISMAQLSQRGIELGWLKPAGQATGTKTDDILSTLIYTPDQIKTMKMRGDYMFRSKSYYSTRNKTAYIGVVCGPDALNRDSGFMGWRPTKEQILKPVVFRIRNAPITSRQKVEGELKKHFDKCFSK